MTAFLNELAGFWAEWARPTAGVPVVLASRVEDGHVTFEDTGREPGLISAGDLAPLKARILLMLALSQGLEGRELARVFKEY